MPSFEHLVVKGIASKGAISLDSVDVSVTTAADIISDSDPEVRDRQQDEFFVTFVIGRGKPEQEQLLSKIPIQVDRFVGGALSCAVVQTIVPVRLTSTL